MHKYEVRTPEQALVYLTDCTLATVADLAMKKSRSKSEFTRQISIAQTGVDWIRDMRVNVDRHSRFVKLEKYQYNVKHWAQEYMPEYK